MRAQQQLLSDLFGIERLALVVGASMGAQQVYEWAVRYPERVLRWVDRIPAGMTVYCGHDQRSTDGRPYRRAGLSGGEAVFLDTGAGKGGHLSWIDLPPQSPGGA